MPKVRMCRECGNRATRSRGGRCEKCGTDLAGTQWDEGGLSCPNCDKAEQIEADTALLEACRETLIDPNFMTEENFLDLLTRLNERLEVK